MTTASAAARPFVAFTNSASKREEALKLGAREVVVSRNPDEWRPRPAASHKILDTVATSTTLIPFRPC